MSNSSVSITNAHGFSLLEVLVAFLILSLSLAVILQIFSTGLRSAALSGDYLRASALAESKLVQIGRNHVLEEGVHEGSFDERFSWQIIVRLADWWEDAGGERLRVRPFEVKVIVSWEELYRTRALSLTTLRLAPTPP